MSPISGFLYFVEGETFTNRDVLNDYLEREHPEEYAMKKPREFDNPMVGDMKKYYSWAEEEHWVHFEGTGLWVWTKDAHRFGFSEVYDPLRGFALFHRATQTLHELGRLEPGRASFFNYYPLPPPPVQVKAPPPPPPQYTVPPKAPPPQFRR